MTQKSSRQRPAWRACLTLLAGLAAAAAAGAQGTVDRQARVWAASCATCHGTDGRAQGAIPALAGQSAEALYRSLIEFKNNQRPAATVMHQHAKGYSDDELQRIARYFAGQTGAAR